MSVSFARQRIISSFVRRNARGWGRPLAFWLDRLRLGGYFAAIAVALIIINSILNHGLAGVLAGHGGLTVFLNLLALLTFVFFLSSLFTYLVPILRATREASEHVSGTVQAAICDANETVPFVRSTYHFITVRLPNGTLRAFAIDPALHDAVCHVGQEVHLTVTPGIERVSVAE
jgi:hypothetical protein